MSISPGVNVCKLQPQTANLFESPHSRLKRTLKCTFKFSAKIERRTEIIERSQSVTRSVGKHGANGKTHVSWHRG